MQQRELELTGTWVALAHLLTTRLQLLQSIAQLAGQLIRLSRYGNDRFAHDASGAQLINLLQAGSG